ncbi:neuralized-like protein 4 isoform X1 [Amyelois transitella]|uniref:neuralized-like protein 4 isoform X1 n=1 Tax=Amyelois transitella TaxID=680683 RepID=UPI00299016D6|nr:neuralized-like protein 4 isoform X1 [Amyelois transitella]
MRFHRRCGDRVTLLNDNSTAIRNFVEFNHGLILSAEPLKNDIMFEVCIDRKVNVWNGSLEIGVTTLDPEYMELPATATKLRNTAWIMSGSSIVKDGVTLVNSYGPELDTLREGDCLGVMRTNKAELLFYINGRSLGVAAKDLPLRLFAVIDLYGQCVQVSIVHATGMRPIMETSLDQIEEDPNNDDTLTSSGMDIAGLPPENSTYPKETTDLFIPIPMEGACSLVAQDRLRFHPRCGILVKLSNYNKSAERARPLDDYNNGVVMTHRPLYDCELFEIRIDKLVDKWSGSIEVGVTTHNPATIRFPSTMTNMDSGTIMMSGCKVLVNGHGTCLEYGNFNLDELREGDTVGMMRKEDGKLHYFINGIDQGIASENVDQQVWGVVDLYGMTVKVSIVDPCEELDSNIQSVPIEATPEEQASNPIRPQIDEESLLFHSLRDSNVIIINDGKTAHRPNAFEFFNNGIVMTNRTLRTGELFQVRLDLVIPKWAGSIEIGVTQNTSNDIQIPFKMSNAKSGTWAMTGEDVIHDGIVVIPQYVRNLNRLVEGDTVGVMRKDMGILHFFVNGLDQGPAAFNIPEQVFGIIDLYGRVAQATIVDTYTPPPPVVYSPESSLSTESNATIYPEMCFHRVHGRNARLSRNRLTATRATVYSEFNDAVLFSSRPLRECDMFELRIDRMVDCWIGSLEIGVTAIRPEDLESHGGTGTVAGTATDLNWDTYILSGSAMMKDGECVRSGYPLDLDGLTAGSRVGMMWHADRSLHYYLDGMDMGKAWYVPHLNIYAVVDLYGQCTQVTILQNEERAFNYNGCANSDNSLLIHSRALASPPPPYWSFSEYCGDNICLLHDYSIARRRWPDPTGALVFSSAHLAIGEIFEIKILECSLGYAGSFKMGITDINILNAHVNRSLPPSVKFLPHYTTYIDGKYLKTSRPGTLEKDIRSFLPTLEWLRTGDRIGLKKTNDSRVLVYYNSELLDICFKKVPDKVYVVMEMYGPVCKIQAVSRAGNVAHVLPVTIPNEEVKLQPVENNMNNATQSAATNVGEQATEAKAGQAKGETANSNTGPNVSANAAEVAHTATTAETVPAPVENATTVSLVTTESRRKRHSLPYTFHYVHGKNIKLCSSDTVAVRTTGYNHAIAIVSQPLRRGHNFRFRVDKVTEEWSGSVQLGAVGALPHEALPACGIFLEWPCWVISADMLLNNGVYSLSTMAVIFDSLTEQQVLSIHFRFNGDLVLDVDGNVQGVIATVPRNYSHVFPLIDLYGRVQQVSVLLHPYIVVSGASFDLPIIAENAREESLAEYEVEEEPPTSSPELYPQDPRGKRKNKSYSQENLFDDVFDPIPVQPGPSSYSHYSRPIPTYPERPEVRCRRVYPHRQQALHHSLIIPDNRDQPVDNNDVVNRCIQKSHSTHNFTVMGEILLEDEIRQALQHTLSLDSQLGDDEDIVLHEDFCDTNIRHNDRYPEANDVDNLDNEIMDALTLETGNLPDLTEEQSSSIDESTRRDDFWSESLSAENLNYLNRILCLDQEGVEGQSLESEWEASGEGCEHLHLVLKYWNFLVLPYPELRQAVSWGQVRCYCSNCQPDAQPPLAGWVRIERIDGVGAAQRAFWHVVRSTLGSSQAAGVPTGVVRRPRSLAMAPSTSPVFDIWFDEEGKPHHTVLAIEIDVEGNEAENDRLLAFLIYLKSHVVFVEDNLPSLED